MLPFKELFAYAVQLSIDGHRSLVLPKRHLFGSDFSFQLLSLRLNSITTKSSLPFSFSSVLVKMPLFHVLISSRASQELLERSRLLQYFMGDYGLYYWAGRTQEESETCHACGFALTVWQMRSSRQSHLVHAALWAHLCHAKGFTPVAMVTASELWMWALKLRTFLI